jgi:hypothetical protein
LEGGRGRLAQHGVSRVKSIKRKKSFKKSPKSAGVRPETKTKSKKLQKLQKVTKKCGRETRDKDKSTKKYKKVPKKVQA